MRVVIYSNPSKFLSDIFSLLFKRALGSFGSKDPRFGPLAQREPRVCGEKKCKELIGEFQLGDVVPEFDNRTTEATYSTSVGAQQRNIIILPAMLIRVRG